MGSDQLEDNLGSRRILQISPDRFELSLDQTQDQNVIIYFSSVTYRLILPSLTGYMKSRCFKVSCCSLGFFSLNMLLLGLSLPFESVGRRRHGSSDKKRINKS